MFHHIGDTYNEIENGVLVDYFCSNGKKYTGPPLSVSNSKPTCLANNMAYSGPINATTAVLSGDFCSTLNYGVYVACDPLPL